MSWTRRPKARLQPVEAQVAEAANTAQTLLSCSALACLMHRA